MVLVSGQSSGSVVHDAIVLYVIVYLLLTHPHSESLLCVETIFHRHWGQAVTAMNA